MRVLGRIRKMIPVVGVAGAALAMAACEGSMKPNAFPTLDDVVAALTTLDGSVTATLVQGQRPAEASGPTANLDGIGTAINGGSLPITVSSTTPFNRVVLAAEGLENYYELTLPGSVTTVDLVASISPSANPTSNMNLLYGLSDGVQGVFAAHGVRIIRVATGDVQVSVTWDSPTDVDLHVTDPSGEEVYFANKTSASGGTLDLDSNAACTIDNVNNENIVWPSGSAPSGTYTVALDYWSDCGEPETNWVVTIQSAGQAPQIFSGKFTGTSGAGTDIPSLATFTR